MGARPQGEGSKPMTSRAPRAACAILLALLIFGALNTIAKGANQPPTPAATSAAPPASPPAGTGEPVQCKVGVDILSVHNLNLENGTFDADFWMWSVCPNGTASVLKQAEFINANAMTMNKYSSSTVDGLVWESAEIYGTFRHRWNLTHFPFDRQQLVIELEDSERDSRELVYQPDSQGSAYEPDLMPGGWRVSAFTMDAGDHVYDTTYGDPRDPTGTSAYSRWTATLTVKRTDLSSFFKLTFVVYIAFLISLISYFLSLRSSNLLIARLTITTAALFAVAVNLNTVTNALGSEDALTMVDQIHVAALVAILIDGVAALITQLLENRGHPAERIIRFNYRVMVVVIILFVSANTWLIGRAALIH